MCFIAAVKRIGEVDAPVEEAIRGMLYDSMMRNSDGYVVVDGENVTKTLNAREASKVIRESNLTNFISHFRIATTGAVTLDNVHWYEQDGWNFMHNGTVWQYSAYGVDAKKEPETDSLKFFKHLVKAVKTAKAVGTLQIAEVIDEVTSDTRFSGRAMFYHQKTDRMFLVGDWEINVVNQNYLVISSTKIDLDTIKNYESYMGFLFIEEEIANFEIKSKSIDDIGVIENFTSDKANYKWIKTLTPLSYNAPRTPNTTPVTRLTDEDDIWMDDLPVPPGHRVNNSGFGIRKVLGME